MRAVVFVIVAGFLLAAFVAFVLSRAAGDADALLDVLPERLDDTEDDQADQADEDGAA
jgi:hypothetical protein